MDLSQIIVDFSNSISGVLWTFLWAVSALIGTFYCGSVLLKLHQAHARPGHVHVSFGQVIAGLIVAAMLVDLSGTLNNAWTTFGEGMMSYGPISYASSGKLGKLAPAVNAALTLASVAGGFFGLKGMTLLWKASMSGHSSHGADDIVWRALTHLIGGAFLIQIDRMVEYARQSLNLGW